VCDAQPEYQNADKTTESGRERHFCNKVTLSKEKNMTEITGKTKIYFIVADPIHQVKTPQLINQLLAARKLDGVMVPTHVPTAGLADFFSGLRGIHNLGGLVVTVPHKTGIVSLCDALTPAAQAVGAVNVVRREADGRLVGDILDGKGFVTGLASKGVSVKGCSAYLAGAGGAANAIAFGLVEAGVSRLTIYNRTAAKVQEMIARIAAVYPDANLALGTDNPAGHDLVVNATSLGMAATDPLPLNVEHLSADQLVAEIIMKPEMTPLLETAQKKGCRIQYGLPMLQSQIELMAEFMGIEK
jgi:shikimate dehydrogenase